MWHQFIKLESSGAIVLFFVAIVAIVIKNSSLHVLYAKLLNVPVVLQVGSLAIAKPLLLWVNDGLMAIFFLLVGLEIKREMLEGELSSWRKSVLPAMAAVGGMLVPALIYVAFNFGDVTALRGWAIPTATDIAFSLGILALLGSRIPVSLKVFLTALAIFDDIGAIVVIAVFYTADISWKLVLLSLLLIVMMYGLNRLRVRSLAPYLLIGLVLWVCVLKSGVHATLAGIAIGFAIPLHDHKQPGRSPLRHLEQRLHPWVAYAVLPVFAFVNAGIDFSGMTAQALVNPVTMGIVVGLFLGKQIGIWLASWIAIRCGIASMPRHVNYVGIYGVSLIAGVGFTMSLFIGLLAFGHLEGYFEFVRLGVIIGSCLSGVMGFLILYFNYPADRVTIKSRS